MKNLADAFRLLTFRSPKSPDAVLSPRAVLAIIVAVSLFDVAIEKISAGTSSKFQLYGVNSQIAWPAVCLAIIVLFAGREKRGETLRLLVLLAAGVSVFLSAVSLLWRDDAESRVALSLSLAAMLVCWALTILGAGRIFKLAGSRRPIWRAIGYTACVWIATIAFPAWPVFLGPEFKRSQANLWEAIADASRSKPTAQQKAERESERREAETRAARQEAAQPALLEAELAGLSPRTPKQSNLFVVGVAGWSDQDVFLKETERSLDIIRSRLHADGKIVKLINNEATAQTHPIADVHNLAHVLRGLARRMNLDDDVLLLTLTSHGSRDGFALENESLVGRTLQPEALKAMLDDLGFKNRVLIVSACYSGVFVPVFSEPRSMVITAASATRTSFGCSNDREWTFFGDAFFAHGLNERPSLSQAFSDARGLVAKWESEKGISPSDPQIYVGEELRRRFPALVGPAEQGEARANSNLRMSKEALPVQAKTKRL
jgi:hypothetical protein